MKKLLKLFEELSFNDIYDIIRLFIKNYYSNILGLIFGLLVLIVPVSFILYADETVPDYKGKTRYQAEMYVYENCHKMTNNFIIAEDKKVRGFVRADKKNIDKILSVIEIYDVDDEDMIVECLEQFKNKDYSSAVTLHNYCWKRLDGEVGYATGIKDKYK